MKAWERERIEYRPTIGYKTRILSRIDSLDNNEYMTKEELNVRPRVTVIHRLASYLGMDAIDSLLASLSRANNLKARIERELAYQDDFARYLELSNSDDPFDDIEANQIHDANMTNINGKPAFDVYPLVADSISEMETYLDFLNEALFDGTVDYNRPEIARAEEERAVEMAANKHNEGEPLDYKKVSSRVQVIATAKSKTEMFKGLLDKSEGYLDVQTRSHFYDDMDTTLLELASIPEEHLSKVRDIIGASFVRDATDSVTNKYNMKRLGDRDVRETLDQEMLSAHKQMHEFEDALVSHAKFDIADPIGSQVVRSTIYSGLTSLKTGFSHNVVENLSNTVQNERQNETLFDKMNAKRKFQDFYHLVNDFENEFDKRDIEKELERFKRFKNL